MIGEHDRQESEQEMAIATRLLQMLRDRLATVPETTPAPFVGSILHEERRYTAREPIDMLIASNRTRARDNLDRVFSLMIDDAGERVIAYPYSIYPLIRASIESSATGLWIIQSDRRNDRVMRALQIAYRNNLDGLSLIRLFGSAQVIADEEARVRRVEDRLNELKDQIPHLRQRTLTGPPKYTDILKAVSPRLEARSDRFEFASPVSIWKMSSSFIHGSDNVTRVLSDVRQLSEFNNGVANFEVTPKIQLLALGVAECIQLLLRLDDRYAHLCTHDYGGRTVPPAYD